MTPHQLCHSFATMLLNAGVPVEALQQLMGHQCIDKTLIYGRVYATTVAEDYYAAMDKIERQLDPNADRDPVTSMKRTDRPVGPDVRARLLALLKRLAEP